MKKILIVSNDETFIAREKTILNRSDLKLITTTSSEDAYKIHMTEKADLIITDLDMPELSGDRLCFMIRNDAELSKVSIIIVCNDDKSDIEKCSHCKANDYITRPVDPQLLLEKVGQLLDIPERENVRVLLKVTVRGKYLNETFFCFSQNISTAGLLIETEKAIIKGDKITCSFFIPGSKSITTEGKIVRVVKKLQKTNKYGIKFSAISPEDKSAIEAFVNKRAQYKSL